MYKHKLLIATRIISDPTFAGTVIFVLGHTKKGAQGIIVNAKEIGKIGFGEIESLFNAPIGDFDKVKNMILEGNLRSIPLLMGGPCHTPGIFFLHGYKEFANIHKDTREEKNSEFHLGTRAIVTEGLYFGSPYTFGHIIEAGKIEEKKFRFFSGLSLWSEGQLDYEVANGAWNIADYTCDLFFDTDEVNKLSIKQQSPYPWMPQQPPLGFDPTWN